MLEVVVVVVLGAFAPTSSGEGGARGMLPSATTGMVESGAADVTTISGLDASGWPILELDAMTGGWGISSFARRLSEPGRTVWSALLPSFGAKRLY